MQFSPTSYHFIPLQSKYSSQHPVLKHPQSTLLPQCQRPIFTPIQNHRQNYISVYSNFYVLDRRQDKRFWTEWYQASPSNASWSHLNTLKLSASLFKYYNYYYKLHSL
jgi:hypothetical protein